jgi:hypothetical protein
MKYQTKILRDRKVIIFDYDDDVNLLGDNINTIYHNGKILLQSKYTGIEENADRTICHEHDRKSKSATKP